MSNIIISEEFMLALQKERKRVADILNVLNPEDENAEIPEMEFDFQDYVLCLTDIADLMTEWSITE